MYERKIYYLDYYERNVKVKNAGYVKLNLHDERFELEVWVKGLDTSESFQAWIELEGMDGMLAPIQIKQGRGIFQEKYDIEHIGGSSISLYAVRGLKIPLPGGRMIRTEFSFQEHGKQEEKRPETLQEYESERETNQEADKQDESPAVKYVQKLMSHPVTEEIDNDIVNYKADSVITKESNNEINDIHVISGNDISNSTANAATVGMADHEAVVGMKDHAADDRTGSMPYQKGTETDKSAENSSAQNIAAVTARQSMDEQAVLAGKAQQKQQNQYTNNKSLETRKPDKNMMEEYISADKWEQLCRTYQQIHPFKGRTYIRLSPKDFIILRKEYQQLVNNSFLLHGFYNYRHLILGKEPAEDGENYYLGVPGTYYDREKMVAVMFGFEGFEASEVSEISGTTSAADISGWRGGHGAGGRNVRERQIQEIRPGTFGYYMKRVEI